MTDAVNTPVESLPVVQTLELLEGIKLLAVSGVKVFADGKVNLADIAILVDLAKQYDILANAIKGIDNVPSETKNIDQAEAIVIIAKVFEIVTAIKAAKG